MHSSKADWMSLQLSSQKMSAYGASSLSVVGFFLIMSIELFRKDWQLHLFETCYSV